MKVTIFVDVQNDFIDGALGCDMAKKNIDEVVKYAEKCVADPLCSMLATQDTHEANYLKTLEGQKLPVEHCIKDTVGWNLREDLYNAFKRKYGPRSMFSYIIEKPTFGSNALCDRIEQMRFYASRLGLTIDEIELCGYCTSICVISNALLLRAANPDMKISLIENLCGDINEESHKAALKVAQNCQIDIKTV